MRKVLYLLVAFVAARVVADGFSDCRPIASSDARLACYDAEVDRTRKDNAPDATFGALKPAPDSIEPSEPTIDSIDAAITALHANPLGKWVIELDNGQTWTQTDSGRLALDTGENVLIHKGRLGSYRLEKASGSRGIAVKRTQ